MSKHTPGPWTAEHGSDDYFYVATEDGVSFPRDEQKANAHLIAAAPEMLEALKLVRESGLADEYGASAVEDAINAAIKKATGTNTQETI
jgi:hypothetical protein